MLRVPSPKDGSTTVPVATSVMVGKANTFPGVVSAWVALTDARYKYIYFTLTGEQQLFDLDTDPHEMNNLVEDTDQTERLTQWRKRMVEHLSIRGEPWIKDGDLAVQSKSVYRGPNFPRP